MADDRRTKTTDSRRPGMLIAGAGLLLLVIGTIGVRMSVGALAGLKVDARPATAAEAPDPAHVDGTYVGDPNAQDSVLPAAKRIMTRLAILALLGALGAALLAWGIQEAFRSRRDEAGSLPEVVPDAEDG